MNFARCTQVSKEFYFDENVSRNTIVNQNYHRNEKHESDPDTNLGFPITSEKTI